MKTTHALILAATVAFGWVVQPALADDQLPPGTPTPAAGPGKPEGAPAAPKKAAPAAKKATLEPLTSSAPLTPGLAHPKQNNVNVRGQAAINSEIVARLKKDEVVTVLEEVTLKRPKVDEPAKWAKVALPTNTAVWVHSSFIDPAGKTVVPNRLNLRSGPGENYSIIGRLEKGAAVKEVEKKGDWLKIEAPAGSYGFVASHLLVNVAATPVVAVAEPPATPATPAAPATPATPATPTTPPEVAVVTPPPTITPAEPIVAPTPAEPMPPATPATPATPPATPAVVAPIPEPPAVTTPVAEPAEEPLIKRIVSREGIVKRSASIQAPTFFALESLDTGKTINYIFSSSTNLPLKDYRGQRIVVTGEEQLDERWPNIPVIYVDSLQAVP